jgi:2-amino-4-hydroxy-6-hydroxymethyldihydropteridine diphosphokinase
MVVARLPPAIDAGACRLRDEVTACIALGANLGDAPGTVRLAMDAIDTLPGTRGLRRSSLYRSAPVQSSGPDYVNAVVQVGTILTAPELLAQLQRLERDAGRERPYRNAPRTLDLDLLLYGSAQLFGPALTVPHPRMAERAFVLLPLAEIAPQLVRPDALRRVADQACRIL